VPSNLSKARLHKAFNEGRRSAKEEAAQNPYDHPKLRQLWDEGRARQRAGEITTPIPALAHGETRAQRPLPAQRSMGSPQRSSAPRPATGRPQPFPRRRDPRR
jgi:hypothetical protein